MIARRLVFLFPGFEPLSADQHAQRFCRAAAKSADTWGFELELPEAVRNNADEGSAASFPAIPVTMSGDGWRTRTEVVVCDWGDIIQSYARRGAGARVAAGLRALGDFVVTGTFFRYCRVSWRYALFFLFPILVALAIVGAGILVALLPGLLDLSAWHALWSIPLALASSAALSMLAARQFHFLTIMDDWAFAYDFCRGRNPEIAKRITEGCATIGERMAGTQVDEVLLVGHSLGACLGVMALADALTAHAPARPVHVLTVGSSLLKTALHPAAKAQRDAVRALVTEHRLCWVDVQALSDPINFYRSNPALSLGIRGGRTPVVHRVSLSRLVAPETYRRIKRNFFRLHRQFVFGAERRRSYSFHTILLGPVAFERYAEAGSVDLPPLPGERTATLPLETRMVAP